MLIHRFECLFHLSEKVKDDAVTELVVAWVIHFKDLAKCVHVDAVNRTEVDRLVGGLDGEGSWLVAFIDLDLASGLTHLILCW